MATINVNQATVSQLIVLLGLTAEEAAKVDSARPFPNDESFRKTLPARFQTGLEIPLLDINSESVENLAATAGISPSIAAKILAGRPYFMMRQVQLVAGRDVYEKLVPFFSVPSFVFVDKLKGKPISLSPDSSHVVVEKPDRETESILPTRIGAERLFRTVSSKYHVYALPETEAATDVVGQIQQAYGSKVIPSFVDKSSARLYLDPQYCVVQFKSGIQPETEAQIIAEHKLTVTEKHHTPGLYTLAIPAAQVKPSEMVRVIDSLNARQEVKFAEPRYFGFDDRDAAAALEANTSLEWNLALIRASNAWNTTKGSPDVVIAIVDSGVDEGHETLNDALVRRKAKESFNFTGDTDPQPTDEDGHGTFIAGILVGNGGMGIHGICPQCKVLPLKVPLTGDVNSYARRRDAILFALERIKPPLRLIINMSWKTTGDIGLIRDACETAASVGAVLIASAGNMPERENEPHYPSDYPSVISVAAITPDRKRADYSYFGDLVDVSAPGGDENRVGSEVFSAAPGGKTTTGAGTSFAAPHVAGIAALVASAHPTLTGPQIRFCIAESAVPLEQPGMGAGLCDASGALSLASKSPGSVTEKGPKVNSHPQVPVSHTALDYLNSLDANTLESRYGLAALTAKLIVRKRPYTDTAQIKGILGLTQQQFTRIVNTSSPNG